MSFDPQKKLRSKSLEPSGKEAGKSRRQKNLSIIILISAVFAVYLVTIAAGFVYDDNTQVLANRWIRDIGYIPEILTSSGTEFMGKKANTYRPMLHLVFMAEFHAWGLNARGYHFVNIVFHAANTVLVFIVAALMFQSPLRNGPGGARVIRFPRQNAQGYIAPFFAAAFFATHPINVEPVAWASAIPELTYTFFLLLSFYLYMRSGEGGRGLLAISAASFFLGLLSKETAVSLLALIAAYDFASRGWGMLRLWKNYVPYMAALAAYAAIRTYAVGGIIHHKQAALSAFESLLNAFPLLFQYFWKLLLPIDLKVIYIFTPAASFADIRVLAGVALVTLTAAGALLARKNRVIFTSIFWMLVPVLPVLYVPALSNSAFAERYLYLPSAGFGVLLAYLTRGALNRAFDGGLRGAARPALIAAVALVVIYSAASVKRSFVWLDELSLWKDTVEKTPASRYAQYNLGVAYGAAKDHERAIAHYREAIRLDPNYVSAYYNLAWTYNATGNEAGAIENYMHVLRLEPNASAAHYNLGLIYMKNKMFDEAIAEFEGAISANPGYAEAKQKLEEALLMKGIYIGLHPYNTRP